MFYAEQGALICSKFAKYVSWGERNVVGSLFKPLVKNTVSRHDFGPSKMAASHNADVINGILVDVPSRPHVPPPPPDRGWVGVLTLVNCRL